MSGAVFYCLNTRLSWYFWLPVERWSGYAYISRIKTFHAGSSSGTKYPTAKYLKTHGTIFVSKSIATNVKISVYQNGYALYEIAGLTTVFPVCACQDYSYEMEESEISRAMV